jgi:excinuclease ABC subunit C
MRVFPDSQGRSAVSLKQIGRSSVLPFRCRFREMDLDAELVDTRRRLRDRCVSKPGVYAFVDRRDEVVYVGVSSKLRARLITYFQSGSADRKEYAIAGQASRVLWQVVGHELVAQLRELELIRRFQPRLNVRGRWPGRPLGYIYLSREDAPRFRFARLVPKGIRSCWGPLHGGWRIRDAVQHVNQQFKLSDCPASVSMHFADQRELFHLDLRVGCLRGETGSCLGPCAGGCTVAEYEAQLRAACAFLDGRNAGPIPILERRLAEAVSQRRFEQAARLRDALESLTTLSERLARLREPAAPSEFVIRSLSDVANSGSMQRTAPWRPLRQRPRRRERRRDVAKRSIESSSGSRHSPRITIDLGLKSCRRGFGRDRRNERPLFSPSMRGHYAADAPGEVDVGSETP